MAEIIQGLIGQQVELSSTDGISVVTDVGILDGYDGHVLRLRKESERLYFPLANVFSLASAASAENSPLALAPSGASLLGELVGKPVQLFPNPHTARIDGILEAADDHFVRLSHAVGHAGPLHGGVTPWRLLPLHCVRLIKPAA
jgi:hypothetical protein